MWATFFECLFRENSSRFSFSLDNRFYCHCDIEVNWCDNNFCLSSKIEKCRFIVELCQIQKLVGSLFEFLDEWHHDWRDCLPFNSSSETILFDETRRKTDFGRSFKIFHLPEEDHHYTYLLRGSVLLFGIILFFLVEKVLRLRFNVEKKYFFDWIQFVRLDSSFQDSTLEENQSELIGLNTFSTNERNVKKTDFSLRILIEVFSLRWRLKTKQNRKAFEKKFSTQKKRRKKIRRIFGFSSWNFVKIFLSVSFFRFLWSTIDWRRSFSVWRFWPKIFDVLKICPEKKTPNIERRFIRSSFLSLDFSAASFWSKSNENSTFQSAFLRKKMFFR